VAWVLRCVCVQRRRHDKHTTHADSAQPSLSCTIAHRAAWDSFGEWGVPLWPGLGTLRWPDLAGVKQVCKATEGQVHRCRLGLCDMLQLLLMFFHCVALRNMICWRFVSLNAVIVSEHPSWLVYVSPQSVVSAQCRLRPARAPKCSAIVLTYPGGCQSNNRCCRHEILSRPLFSACPAPARGC
jgi:hypothetical protein